MRIVVVGSVAAGTAAGAKARRNAEDAEIVVHDRDCQAHLTARGVTR